MRVVLARNPERGEKAAQRLRDENLDVVFEQMDVTNNDSVQECAQRLSDAGTAVDVLVNNAGVTPPKASSP